MSVLDDVGYCCVTDFRLNWLPAGSQPVGCLMSIGGFTPVDDPDSGPMTTHVRTPVHCGGEMA